jgi:hypothetical protein
VFDDGSGKRAWLAVIKCAHSSALSAQEVRPWKKHGVMPV